jgi:hypothetical protein
MGFLIPGGFSDLKKFYKLAILAIHHSALGTLDPFDKLPILVQSPDFFDVNLLFIRRRRGERVLTKISAQILPFLVSLALAPKIVEVRWRPVSCSLSNRR